MTYIETLRTEYHDLTHHLSNVKIRIEAECRRQFEEIDTNGSGFITVDEYLSRFFTNPANYEPILKALVIRAERYKQFRSFNLGDRFGGTTIVPCTGRCIC